MTQINLKKYVKCREEKICTCCANYVEQTQCLEGECLEGNDLKSEEFCDEFTIKEN